jgi:hypothetical protein
MLTVNVWPADAVTPHIASLVTSLLVLQVRNGPHRPADVGASVGSADGAAVGAVGATVGCADGKPGPVVGPAEGRSEGAGEGSAVVGRSVGMLVGIRVGVAEGAEGAALGAVGVAVGAYVTRCTPAPDTTAVPEHDVLPWQPSWIRYVCVAVPAGTVYCTCAHTLPLSLHAAGGWLPEPVSSYATSVPDAL